MLKHQKSSQYLVLPRINTRNKLEVSNKWKKAERRLTIISFPKIKIKNRKNAKEKSTYKDTFCSLPIINAELESDTDYFSYYLKSENVIQENDSLVELEKFTLFCKDDEKQEAITSNYFSTQGREILKNRQLKTLEKRDLSKQKEIEIFKRLNEQQKTINNGGGKNLNLNFEKSYYSMVEDFAHLSFELCSLKAFEQQSSAMMMPQNFNGGEGKNNNRKENVKLYKNEISKEEAWISKIEEKILEKIT